MVVVVVVFDAEVVIRCLIMDLSLLFDPSSLNFAVLFLPFTERSQNCPNLIFNYFFKDYKMQGWL